MSEEKKILSKFEWFLLIVSLGLLAVVVLQNQGIHAVETVTHTEISDAKEVSKKAVIRKKERSKELNELIEYFATNRAKAHAEKTSFDWNSLKIAKDEENYLKNKYGDAVAENPSGDWLSYITTSYNTYKSVKATFEAVGLDADEIINTKNARKALANPIIANSIFQKLEDDFGIPAERSRAFAEENQQNLENWAGFVEAEIGN